MDNTSKSSSHTLNQKSYIDKKRKPLELEVGDHVYLLVSPPQRYTHLPHLAYSPESRDEIIFKGVGCDTSGVSLTKARQLT